MGPKSGSSPNQIPHGAQGWGPKLHANCLAAATLLKGVDRVPSKWLVSLSTQEACDHCKWVLSYYPLAKYLIAPLSTTTSQTLPVTLQAKPEGPNLRVGKFPAGDFRAAMAPASTWSTTE